MSSSIETDNPDPLILAADTAADMMAANLISIRGDATLPEAIALLTDKGFSAAPVIDEAGKPIGVLSSSDILAHYRERLKPGAVTGFAGTQQSGSAEPMSAYGALVKDLMTPAVFSVRSESPARNVVADMVSL